MSSVMKRSRGKVPPIERDTSDLPCESLRFSEKKYQASRVWGSCNGLVLLRDDDDGEQRDFYPADETPGCTKQACAFRDSYEKFKKAGAEIVGISGDDPSSHKAFAKKYRLPFTLLSDEGNKVRKEWGVPAEKIY